ncbi:MAG TPA: twin-arginine translocase subunit TatC [Chloroflexia bacterium]|nr:twin-arginine translocase subunit TatC [Chloroflexia bacterium]
MSTTATPRRRLPFPRGRKPAPPARIRPDGSRDVELPLIEHLRELRSRLVKAALSVAVATVISFLFVEQTITLLLEPAGDVDFIAIAPTETFINYLKVAFYAGIAISMPLLVYQIFRFLAPGLTRTERRWVLLSLPAVTFLFVLGLVFCYSVLLRPALGFLLGFGSDRIVNMPSISLYLSFVTRFLLAVSIAFQTPVIVFLLSKLGVATPKRLAKFRRWAYVLAFVMAAIITPTPDPINQSFVAIPIILLYELGIIFARIGGRPRKPEAAA